VSLTEGEQPYITASEVGNFTYCPEAWFLQRFGHSPDADAMQRLHDGTRRHQWIGRTTARLVGTDDLRRVLLIIVIGLAALLLAASLDLINLPARPWGRLPPFCSWQPLWYMPAWACSREGGEAASD
jgi:hypothetical protein